MKRKFILDTDLGPDCDDCGALAILDSYHKAGKAELLGVTTDTLLTGAPSAHAPEARAAKKPEELVVCIQIVSDDGTVFRCNLPFKAFRICTQFSMLSITYNAGAGDENMLTHLDCEEISRLIESGVTGKLLERTEEDETITIWTE